MPNKDIIFDQMIIAYHLYYWPIWIFTLLIWTKLHCIQVASWVVLKNVLARLPEMYCFSCNWCKLTTFTSLDYIQCIYVPMLTTGLQSGLLTSVTLCVFWHSMLPHTEMFTLPLWSTPLLTLPLIVPLSSPITAHHHKTMTDTIAFNNARWPP